MRIGLSDRSCKRQQTTLESRKPIPDILPILLRLQPVLPKKTCRQLAHIVVAVLAMTGRITQRGISRWTDKGARYRTIQRFFYTNIDWLALNASFFFQFLWDRNGDYLLAGDETVIRKSGKKTFDMKHRECRNARLWLAITPIRAR